MLDLSKPIEVQYISGGLQKIMVRWPTDAEWCARNRKTRIVTKDLGRQKSQTDTYGLDEANAELVAAIRVDEGDALDPADASEVVRRLETIRVLDSECGGDRVTVNLRAMGFNLAHVLRFPSGREKQDHFKASIRPYGVKGGREYRQSLEPSGELYDRLHLSHSGYECAVPIIHKEAALSEVFSQIDSLITAGDDDPEQ